jgi:hypothetical protein
MAERKDYASLLAIGAAFKKVAYLYRGSRCILASMDKVLSMFNAQGLLDTEALLSPILLSECLSHVTLRNWREPFQSLFGAICMHT